MLIVLCGYMGSGKSLIGRKLAEKLNYSFLDLDDEIEADQGMKISEIFAFKGEIAFRKTEMEVLKKRLLRQKNTVLALGGGTPCYGDNLVNIKKNKKTVMVYLKVSAAALTDRLFLEMDKRPLLHEMDSKEKLNEYIRKHLFERQFYYLQSDFKVDASTKTSEALVDEIIGLLD